MRKFSCKQIHVHYTKILPIQEDMGATRPLSLNPSFVPVFAPICSKKNKDYRGLYKIPNLPANKDIWDTFGSNLYNCEDQNEEDSNSK